MNMFEEARALDGTIRLCHMTQEELAEKLHVSQSYIANKLRLLQFSDELQKQIADGGLNERQARTVLRLKSEASRRLAVSRAEKEKLNVAMTERLVDMLLATEEETEADEVRKKTISHLSAVLVDAVGILNAAGIRSKRVTEESSNEIRITFSVAK